MKSIVRPIKLIDGAAPLPSYTMRDEPPGIPNSVFVDVPDADATEDGLINEQAIRTRYGWVDFVADEVYADL